MNCRLKLSEQLKDLLITEQLSTVLQLKTPLEETAVCLPMAEVEFDCVFGHVITKAAVLRDSLDQEKYLLGNKTAALFERSRR
ncbi:retrovirus-related Pol polyprotein from transposon 412 [Trichonephila clavipes]|nr:retrovirus-related Pol polyprotein from transposon 412 [Trichonephila clavipes]